jgi:nitrogen fixation protein NifU and related proteins
MAYSLEVLKRFENPTHAGSLDKHDPNVGIGLGGSPSCGDVAKLSILVNPETSVIEQARFLGFGCGSLIASSQKICELIEGKTVDQAEQIKNTVIAEELSLPPIKAHCSLLAEDVVKAAIIDWRKKRAACAA